jgi:hypothetical protein
MREPVWVVYSLPVRRWPALCRSSRRLNICRSLALLNSFHRSPPVVVVKAAQVAPESRSQQAQQRRAQQRRSQCRRLTAASPD